MISTDTETTGVAPLPAGYTARPTTLADVGAVVAMLNAGTQALLGRDEHAVNDWAMDWQQNNYNLAENTRLLLAPNGEVAGYVGLWDRQPHTRPELYGRTAPAHTGRGLGTHLAQWVEMRARHTMQGAPASAGVVLHAWVNGLDKPATQLLADNGYQKTRTYWRMIIELDPAPPAPIWPDGIGVRAFVPEQDERATLMAINGAFQDSHGYVERPFEEHLADWTQRTRKNPEFDPSLWFLAMAGDEVIGTAFTRLRTAEDPQAAWLFTLGVTRPWRKRGVAQALLLHAFGEMRRRGRQRVILGVDSDSPTNALHLYEKAGMHADPTGTEEVWEKELRAAAAESET